LPLLFGLLGNSVRPVRLIHHVEGFHKGPLDAWRLPSKRHGAPVRGIIRSPLLGNLSARGVRAVVAYAERYRDGGEAADQHETPQDERQGYHADQGVEHYDEAEDDA
jgi:hypothetical protein